MRTRANYLSQNPSFCISALRRYTQHDFIGLIEAAGIAYHERTLGQLFCDGSGNADRRAAGPHAEEPRRHTEARHRGVTDREDGRGLQPRLDPGGTIACQSLVVACGGKSIPKMGATGFGYEIAQQFGLAIVETRPALVPLTLDPDEPGKAGPAGRNRPRHHRLPRQNRLQRGDAVHPIAA